jgi:hypothetical protein
VCSRLEAELDCSDSLSSLQKLIKLLMDLLTLVVSCIDKTWWTCMEFISGEYDDKCSNLNQICDYLSRNKN